MRNYIGEMVDLTNDGYINPAWNGHYRNLNQITEIGVHHDASFRPHDYDSIARYRSEAQGHYDRLGPGLQYHYKIDNTGVIFKIRPHNMWLHAVGSSKNVSTINICLDGCFHKVDYINGTPQQGTREQYEALKQLLDNLSTEHPEFPATQANVFPHSHFSATACCGSEVIPWVDAYRLNNGNVPIPNVPYDWPELQPTINPTPAPPKAAPVATTHTDGLFRVYVDGKQVGAYSKIENAFRKADIVNGVVKFHGQVVEKPVTPEVTPPPSSGSVTVPVVEEKNTTSIEPEQPKTERPEPDYTDPSQTPGSSQLPNTLPLLTIPLINTIIRSIKDFFTMNKSGRFTSRKFWLTVAINVIAVVGAVLEYFTSTQTATLAGAATVAYIAVNGLIEATKVKNQ